MKRLLVKLKGPRTKIKDFSRPSPKTSSSQPNVIPNTVTNTSKSEANNTRPNKNDNKCGSQASSPFESLPPEVRHHVLRMMPLEDLHNLIRASPVYLQQYLLGRISIIHASLEMTLRNTVVDACAVYRSSPVEFTDARSSAIIAEFSSSYQIQRSDPHYSIRSEGLIDDEIMNMAKFHCSVIRPLVRTYTERATNNLAHETGTAHQAKDNRLSKTEEFRLIRGMYRFQLLCNLFGGASSQKLTRFSPWSEDILILFFSLFEPWEVEEICCIYLFVKEKYKQIFQDILWDLHQENPKFGGQYPPTPDGAFDLSNSWECESYLTGTVSRGLTLLHTILYLTRDHEHLVTTMQEWISRAPGCFLDSITFSDTPQQMRRRDHPSERDEKEERRDPLPFRGDHEDEMYAPLAWTLIWGGTYSNLYGWYIPDAVRDWGYIFWDSARIDRIGAREVLARQWTDCWSGYDPRDCC